ncbi:MAG: hypothetical protein M3X11_07245, partial [Acidobacteriota bacterium]|nr:hypothetical protein [Acidobacteriota bacterium]
MRFKTMATITAVTFTVVGLGFVFQEISWLGFFNPFMRLSRSLPESQEHKRAYFWMFGGLRSFASLYGAALCGCGLMAWALR